MHRARDPRIIDHVERPIILNTLGPLRRSRPVGGSFALVAIGLGYVSLALAIISTVLVFITPLTLALAALAVIGLSFDRRFGPLPAALLVILVLPYDRAANGFIPRISDIPVRPQDVALGLGLLLSLPSLRRLPPWRPITIALAAFLGVGLLGFVVGLVADNAVRDILRDTRWWALYGVGLVALATDTPRASLLRALLLGTTLFAVLVVITAILPIFADGLKLRALEFDRGLLRMQFGNSTMLLAPLAFATMAVTRAPSRRSVAWLVLITTAVVLTLTRTFILVSAVVVGIAVVLSLVDRAPSVSRWRAAVPAAAAGTGLVLGVGLATFALAVTGFIVPLDRLFGGSAGPSVPVNGEEPLERLLLQGSESGLDSLGGGRFVTYGRAIDVLRANPVIGSGLGALVVAEYSFGGEAFDTPGKLPNVDNAWLTIGMKAGMLGVLAFGALVLAALLEAVRSPKRMRRWLLPFWLGVIALTMTQSFATTGYGPAVLGLVAVLPILRYTPRSTYRALDQR